MEQMQESGFVNEEIPWSIYAERQEESGDWKQICSFGKAIVQLDKNNISSDDAMYKVFIFLTHLVEQVGWQALKPESVDLYKNLISEYTPYLKIEKFGTKYIDVADLEPRFNHKTNDIELIKIVPPGKDMFWRKRVYEDLSHPETSTLTGSQPGDGNN